MTATPIRDHQSRWQCYGNEAVGRYVFYEFGTLGMASLPLISTISPSKAGVQPGICRHRLVTVSGGPWKKASGRSTSPSRCDRADRRNNVRSLTARPMTNFTGARKSGSPSSGMKDAGDTIPQVGWRMRTSAGLGAAQKQRLRIQFRPAPKLEPARARRFGDIHYRARRHFSLGSNVATRSRRPPVRRVWGARVAWPYRAHGTEFFDDPQPRLNGAAQAAGIGPSKPAAASVFNVSPASTLPADSPRITRSGSCWSSTVPSWPTCAHSQAIKPNSSRAPLRNNRICRLGST